MDYDCSEFILQEWPLALQLILDVGKQRVLKPTLVTQNTLMGALAGAGRWQMALRAFKIVDPDAWPGFVKLKLSNGYRICYEVSMRFPSPIK